jgi:hypothetical protein
MLSRGKHLSVLVVLVITLVGLLGTTAPSHASASTINGFFADCERFSVDVTMQGITNDGGGFDKFRYMVVDGDGNTLYAEDSARQTGISDRSAILDLAYDENIGARPVQNPITFKVIDLDGNARPGAVLREATYNAACLSISDSANAPDNFLSLVRTEGKLLENTTLYYAPGYQYPTGARAFKGDKLSIVYRSNDDQWIGALISPHDMIWVPAGAIDVALFGLPIQPTRIDPSQQVTGAIIPTGNPVGTARALYTVRLRAGPSIRFPTLTRIPFGSTITVYGRNAFRTWYKVSFNGLVGWVSAPFVRLIDISSRALPIVQ